MSALPEPKITFTHWVCLKGKQKAELQKPWSEVYDWLKQIPPSKKKTDAKLIKLALFGNQRTEKGSLRHDANVLEITGIEGDYDAEVITPEYAIEKLESFNLKAIVVTTHSHTDEKPRYRVLTPLSEAASPDKRVRYVEILNGMLGGILASESKTLSQSYFVGGAVGAPYKVLHTFDDPDEGHTLDELDEIENLDQLRQGFGKQDKQTSDNGEFDFDSGDYDDWVNQLCSGESVHPSMIKIVGHYVAKGWEDKDIKTLFIGLADQVEKTRGKARADLIRGKELDDAITSARAKGFAPRSFNEILEDAKQLTVESETNAIDALVKESFSLPAIQKRNIQNVIKKQTGTPFSVMREAEREEKSTEGTDDLQLARGLVMEIEPQNIIATNSFVYHWLNSGVWKKQEDRAIKQWIQHYLSENSDDIKKSNVDSVTDLFKTEIYKPNHEFNIGPTECVNTLNGELILNNEHWELMPHNQEHYRTTQIPVNYDPDEKAPRFIQFMNEVFNSDPDADDKKQALLEMMGYTLMTHCRHEKFIILVGSGANGKSVLLSLLEALTGADNVAGVQPSQFDRSFQRAHLHGKLANIVTEIKQGEVIDDASLKGIVSGEPTTVEHKFKDPFVMRPFSTCWFGTNHMPHTRDFSDALFRRALVVEFNNKFKPELGNCDPQLKDKLMLELSGILNLALDAYANAVKNGFTMPDSCKQARERWRLEADQVAQFVEDECERLEGGKVIPLDLFDAYREWASENGIHKQMASKSFGDRLENLGFERKKTNGIRYIVGIKCPKAVKFRSYP